METIRTDITIDNQIASATPTTPNETPITQINTGKENTKVILETITLQPNQNTGALDINSIDFSRIALSAQDAINGNFISATTINKNTWSVSSLKKKKKENGSIAIYSGETILGFTDQAGISLKNVTPVTNTTPNTENPTTKTPNTEKSQNVETINTEPIEEQTPIETTRESNNATQTFNGVSLKYDEAYNISGDRLTKSKGRINFNNHQETYYSEKVLPGGGLDIPGRHVAQDGTIRDAEGYICIAANANYLPKGATTMTSLGPAKVYDTAAAEVGVIDIYVSW